MHIQCISHTKNPMNPIEKPMDLKHSLSSYTGWWYTYPSEKYEFVSWDDYSQYMGNNKTCAKPPTSIYSYCVPLGRPGPTLDSHAFGCFMHSHSPDGLELFMYRGS